MKRMEVTGIILFLALAMWNINNPYAWWVEPGLFFCILLLGQDAFCQFLKMERVRDWWYRLHNTNTREVRK